MISRYKQRLLGHLQHETYEPAAVDALAEDLGFESAEGFAQAVKTLVSQGVIVVTASGKVILPSYGDSDGEIVGEFRKARGGFGFVVPEQVVREGDLFVPEQETLDALSGDTVRVQVMRDKRRKGGGARGGGQSGFVGRVMEVLERKRSAYTGELTKRGHQWLAYPDGRQLSDPVVIRDAEAKNAREGIKVVFELVEYPEGDMLGEGVITKVLGEAGRPDVETEAVIAAYSLPSTEFPPACVDEARDASHDFEEQIAGFLERGNEALTGREDWTDRFVCTIDPPDAKDYDDAISIRKLDDGGWELAVHIADVAHFIAPGSRLDVEAMDRGNSVYLPRLVIPMLPEVLSNGICSLQEGVPRFCKTAIIRYDTRGRVKARGAAATIIKSAKRMTYLEAQALIDGDPEEARRQARTEPAYTPELIATVKMMNDLARVIKKRRHQAGMISLELPDAELIFDDEGKVIDAEPEDDAFTHTIIEMFMVEANEVLGSLFEKLEVPLIRRIHPEPTPGDVDEMRQVARVAGFVIPKNPSREEMQGLLDSTRGKPAARAVHMAVLRTLTKAEYSPALIGHFALASEAYAHFTSPIRRYPDLTVHRALAAYLELTENGSKPPRNEREVKAIGAKLRDRLPDQQDLMKVGRHCTGREQNATDGERELRKFLVLQLLETKIGEVFQGVVTGCNPRGLFVQIDKYLIDGFIKTSDMPGDVTRDNARPNWRHDSKSGSIVDQASGRSFSMGDLVTVMIAGVDMERRELDLTIADAAGRAAGKSKKPALTLGSDIGGGVGEGGGAGFGSVKKPGGQRRNRKSKSRDRGKTDYRDNRKKKKKK